MTILHSDPIQIVAGRDARLDQACEVMHAAYARGWITHRDGNISVRAEDGDGLWISQSGVVKARLRPEQMLRVSAEQLANGPVPQGASGEYALHRLLQARLHAGYDTVLHLHPTHIVAAMYAGHDLRELCETFPEVTRYSRVGKNVGALPSTSEELAAACVEVFEPQLGPMPHIVGLDRHGVAAIGRSPWDAYEHVERLEHVCQMVLASGVRHAVIARTSAPGAEAAQAA